MDSAVDMKASNDMQVQAEIDGYLTKLEDKHGYHFAEGGNKDIEFMAHLWEPLRVMHKPLAMFLTSEAVSVLTDVTLFCMGFKLQRCQVGHLAILIPCKVASSILTYASYMSC